MAFQFEFDPSLIKWPEVVDPLPEPLVEKLGPDRLGQLYVAKLKAAKTQLRAQQTFVNEAIETLSRAFG